MNAWRSGYCDALFFRDCKAPWKGWFSYLEGYLHGQTIRKQLGIKRMEGM